MTAESLDSMIVDSGDTGDRSTVPDDMSETEPVGPIVAECTISLPTATPRAIQQLSTPVGQWDPVSREFLIKVETPGEDAGEVAGKDADTGAGGDAEIIDLTGLDPPAPSPGSRSRSRRARRQRVARAQS
jgi:hypothetical protein